VSALALAGFSAGIVAVPPALAGTKAGLAAQPVQSDFDHDGFADVAIGVPGDDVGQTHQAGTVTVLYGTANGPDLARVQSWSAASPGVNGLAVAHGRFGTSLAAGDFDGDGIEDLAIGANGEPAGSVQNAGAVHVLFGSPIGLTAAGDQRWTLASAGVPGDPKEDDQFGEILAAGEFGHGPQDDLAVDVDEATVGAFSQAGAVSVLYGSTHGLGSAGAQLFTQATPGVPSVPSDEEGFGHALLAANLGRGTQDELVIGTPQDQIGGLADVGSVTVLFGSASGLSTTGRLFITEDDLGTPVQAQDEFGHALAAGNFGSGAPIDLAVGAPGADVGGVNAAGVVFVVRGTTNGLGLDGAQRWTQAATGTGQTEVGDFFGDELAAGKFGRSSQADLAVGAPLEDISTSGGERVDAGAITVLYGSQTGLSATGAQGFNQSAIGVGAAVEASDYFGFVLTALPLGNGVQSDLVMGDPLEDIGDVFDSGAVFAMYGSSTGLTTANADSWNANTPGIPGDAFVAGRFGNAVS
jgi:hypothetical protein